MAIPTVQSGDVLSADKWNLLIGQFNQLMGPLSIDNRSVTIKKDKVLSFEKKTRQMLNLWGEAYGIGVQGYTQYFRTHHNFAWYSLGKHNDTPFSPGQGGRRLMGINNSGDLILSARTNPESNPNKSPCRALVDYTNKLYINYDNDFKEGVYVDGNANVLSLVGKDHSYIEFFPKGLNRSIPKVTARDKYRWAWMGYGSHSTKDFAISNKMGKIQLHQASDLYLKKDITEAKGILDKVMKMRPVLFRYKTDDAKSAKHLGIIAQEIKAIFPELVKSNKNKSATTLTVDYQAFSMIAIQAIRELKAEVNQLKEKLAS